MRDAENVFERYIRQLADAISVCGPNVNWYLSIYENDSVDATPQLLANLDPQGLVDYSIVSETIGTTKYGSIVSEDRVKNLANSRNKCLEAKDFYKNVDYILFVETDIIYNPDYIFNLLDFRRFGIESIDILTGISVLAANPHQVYDTWATRRNDVEEEGGRFPDWHQYPIRDFWSTFNGVALYNAEPFKKGIRFDWFNKRLNKADCDTTVICELFREAGYNKIIVNQMATCIHE